MNLREQLDRIMKMMNLHEQKDNIINFLSDKKFINPRSKIFLFHGTNKPPETFSLHDEYEWEDSHVWSGDLPYGYLFLTTDIKEAKSYGQYIIPCELKYYNNITFKVNTDNPSRAFDMDYGIDLYLPEKRIGFWDKFENSGKDVLIIKGLTKSTIITYIQNIIPRTDLAKQYYG